MELAKEAKEGNSLQFHFNNPTVRGCIELLSKLESSASGFDPSQYIRAKSFAIESISTECEN